MDQIDHHPKSAILTMPLMEDADENTLGPENALLEARMWGTGRITLTPVGVPRGKVPVVVGITLQLY